MPAHRPAAEILQAQQVAEAAARWPAWRAAGAGEERGRVTEIDQNVATDVYRRAQDPLVATPPLIVVGFRRRRPHRRPWVGPSLWHGRSREQLRPRKIQACEPL